MRIFKASYIDRVQQLEFGVGGVGVSYNDYESQIPKGWRRATEEEIIGIINNWGWTPAVVAGVNSYADLGLQTTDLVLALGITSSNGAVQDSRGMVKSISPQSEKAQFIGIRDFLADDAPDLFEGRGLLEKDSASTIIGHFIVTSYFPPPSNGKMSGFITDNNRNGVAGASVWLLKARDNNVDVRPKNISIDAVGRLVRAECIYKTISGSSGYYEFSCLVDGIYAIAVIGPHCETPRANAKIKRGIVWGSSGNINLELE